ncbi:ribonuclease III [candidate division KSB1 bacterium]|nr:MAG: ribonuclease III [candidate division KSB1 bacterium]
MRRKTKILLSQWVRQIARKLGLDTKATKVKGEVFAKYSELQQKLGYQFKSLDLLLEALTHRSCLSDPKHDSAITNERLEFLGDSVVGLVVSNYLFATFPEKNEGELTEIKSLIVSRKILAKVARSLEIGKYIRLGMGEEKSGGRERNSIISNAVEALIGAVYVDGGYQQAGRVINKLLLSHVNEFVKSELAKNYKSKLLEYSQSQGWGTPEYEICTETGPDHAKVFEAIVRVQGQKIGLGSGRSKKQAEQNAAREALETLNQL